jgi:hypothetical protein
MFPIDYYFIDLFIKQKLYDQYLLQQSLSWYSLKRMIQQKMWGQMPKQTVLVSPFSCEIFSYAHGKAHAQ